MIEAIQTWLCKHQNYDQHFYEFLITYSFSHGNQPYIFFILQKNYVLTIVRVNHEEFVTHPVDIAIAKMTLLVLAVPSRFPQMPNVNQILIVQKMNFVILHGGVNPLQQTVEIRVTCHIVTFVVMVRNVKLRTERRYAHAMVRNGLEIRIHTW